MRVWPPKTKTPCDPDSFSFGWIDPSGKLVKLPRWQSHNEWAWKKLHGDGWYQELYDTEGDVARKTLIRDGWIRSVNSFALDFDPAYVSPRAMSKAIDLLTTCIVQGRTRPDKVVVWWGLNEEDPVADFVHQFGTRAQEDAMYEGLIQKQAYAKTPCESESTSFAWIDPSGKVIPLPRKQSHVEWAWRRVHGSGWDEDFDWDEGMELSDDLLHEGWVRVPNSFTLEFDQGHVSPRAMATAVDGLVTCTVEGRKDPEKEIVWATPGSGVLKIPVADFVHQYGTRAQEDALFGGLMHVVGLSPRRVAAAYLTGR